MPGTSSLNLVVGASLRLLCKSKTNDSVNVRWQLQPEDESDAPEEVTTDPAFNVYQNASSSSGGVAAALLTIGSMTYPDRAFYICRVDNGVAAFDVRVLIRVKDKLAALWPFLAIVGEVLVLCTVIFVYEKRRTKATDLDDDPPPVTRSVSSASVPVSASVRLTPLSHCLHSKPSSPAKSAHEVRQRK